MTLGGLAPMYRKRVLVPVLVDARASRSVDLVTVRLATGQAPADFADRAANLAHAFGAELCRVRELEIRPLTSRKGHLSQLRTAPSLRACSCICSCTDSERAWLLDGNQALTCAHSEGLEPPTF
jgi:hypothetical protein